MKAIGSCARSPNSRGRYQGEAEHAIEGETVRSQQGSGRASDEVDGDGMDACARAYTATQDAGTAGKHGIIPEVPLPNPEFQGEKITEMEGVDGLMSGGDNLSLSTDGLGAFTRPMNQIEVNGPMNQIVANRLQRVEK